jgi:uncharacterized protein YcbX
MNELGHVCELVRYPVKSMAGTVTESAFLGWHGLDGDRRFAFRRLGDDSGFPWLTASQVQLGASPFQNRSARRRQARVECPRGEEEPPEKNPNALRTADEE